MSVITPPAAGATPIDLGSVTTATLQNAQGGTSSQNGSAFSVIGKSTVAFMINPTSFGGTVNFKGSVDNTNYVSLLATKLGTTTVATNSAAPSAVEIWVAEVGGLLWVEATLSNMGANSGTVTVTAFATPVANAVPVGSTIGTAVIQANSGTALVADQTNSELRVSNYGKSSTAGDIALRLNALGELYIISGGLNTTPVAAAAAAAAIKASVGALHKIVVTTLGTAALSFYDNASTNSGTILFTVPASAAVGSIYDVHFPAANGIWCASGSNTPAVTVGWS